MPLTTDFDPDLNGWYFRNWGEGPEFGWDLFRDSYLGINPTHDCVQAPLDCAFYEIFKTCAAGGNCGGMSLLALALFKYGGYMGFCSPASFYTGTSGPDRADLHRAINIFQARQFSVGGIENFMDVVDAGNLNNAEAAYARIEEGLGSNNFAVLSLANGLFGDDAHTLIPYKCYSSGGTKYLELWDSNFPADDNPGHYGSANSRLVIHGPTDWEYFPNPLDASPSPYPYRGSNMGWCFAIPMSLILPKDRHPFTLDLVFDALQTVFLSGSGAAMSQISDEEGHTFYQTEKTVHLNRGDIETDPAKRLKGVMRWPWYGGAEKRTQPGELYFIRGAASRSPLKFTVSGTDYAFTHFRSRNMITLEARSERPMKDVIRIASTPHDLRQTVEVRSMDGSRVVNLRALRTDEERGVWKSVEVKQARLAQAAMRVRLVGALDDVRVEGIGKKVGFDLELRERKNNRIKAKQYKRIAAEVSKPFVLGVKRTTKR